MYAPKPPKPAEDPDIRAVATVIVLGGMLLVFALVVLAVALLVRWIAQRSEAEAARRLQERLRLQAQTQAIEAEHRAALMAQYGAVEAARRWEAEQRERARREAEEHRYQDLVQRFGAHDAARIMRHEVWRGQSQAALLEALGKPFDVDEKVLKTKVRRVLKWGPTSGRSFRVKVTVVNGIVEGWER